MSWSKSRFLHEMAPGALFTINGDVFKLCGNLRMKLCVKSLEVTTAD